MILALEASKQTSPEGVAISGYRFCRVAFKTALEIPDTDEGIEVSISLHPQPNSSKNDSRNTYGFRVYSFQSAEWIEHCSGAVSVEYELSGDSHTFSQDGNTLQNIREAFERSCPTKPPTPDMYGVFSSLDLALAQFSRIWTTSNLAGNQAELPEQSLFLISLLLCLISTHMLI